MQFKVLKPSEIIIPDNRLRELDQEFIAELRESIEELGLLEPLVVDKDYNLIAGEHRLAAIRESVIVTEVPVVIVDSLSEDQKTLAEFDENYVRKNFTKMELSLLYLKLENIYKAMGEKNTSSKIAKKQNETKRMVNLRLKIGRMLKENPELRKELSNLDGELTFKRLVALTNDEELQEIVVNQLKETKRIEAKLNTNTDDKVETNSTNDVVDTSKNITSMSDLNKTIDSLTSSKSQPQTQSQPEKEDTKESIPTNNNNNQIKPGNVVVESESDKINEEYDNFVVQKNELIKELIEVTHKIEESTNSNDLETLLNSTIEKLMDSQVKK